MNQKVRCRWLILFGMFMFWVPGKAQIDGDQTGAWYMLFWNTTFKEGPWGLQGDYQFRNWDLGGDLEQLLLRTGVTYQPIGTSVKFTQGYGNITTGEFGEGSNTVSEHRLYQEALLPQKLAGTASNTRRLCLAYRISS